MQFLWISYWRVFTYAHGHFICTPYFKSCMYASNYCLNVLFSSAGDKWKMAHAGASIFTGLLHLDDLVGLSSFLLLPRGRDP
jgi:hypothetical protein